MATAACSRLCAPSAPAASLVPAPQNARSGALCGGRRSVASPLHCARADIKLESFKLKDTRRPNPWRCAVTDSAEPSVAEGIIEVNKDTFYPALQAAGDKLVVLDMFTQWCGPCKMLEPKIKALVPEYTDVVFLKLDCNQENKSLAKELGVRVVPTFKLFRYKEMVAEVVGAKFDLLLTEINKWRL